MGFIGKIINQTIENSVREIVTELFDNYPRVSVHALPPGIDSAPLNEDQGISIIIDNSGRSVNIGVYPDAEAAPGEIRFYSRDSGGTIKSLIWLRTDGTIEINGTGDFLTRFTKLESGLQDMVDLANTTFLTAAQGGVKAGGLTLDIADAKIDELKVSS